MRHTPKHTWMASESETLRYTHDAEFDIDANLFPLSLSSFPHQAHHSHPCVQICAHAHRTQFQRNEPQVTNSAGVCGDKEGGIGDTLKGISLPLVVAVGRVGVWRGSNITLALGEVMEI